MDKKLMKRELREAAQAGIDRYLSSTRGAHMFGTRTELAAIDGNTLQIRVPTQQGPEYFVIKVTSQI